MNFLSRSRTFWTPLSLPPLLMAGGALSALTVQFPQKSFLHPSCASCWQLGDAQMDSSSSVWSSGPQPIAGVTSPARTMCHFSSAPTGSWTRNAQIKVLWTEGTNSLVPLGLNRPDCLFLSSFSSQQTGSMWKIWSFRFGSDFYLVIEKFLSWSEEVLSSFLFVWKL